MPQKELDFPNDLDITLVSLIAKARGQKNNFQTRLFFQTMDVNKALKRDLPRIGGCFATALDGCFGATDAALHEPYSHDPGNKGILYHQEEEVFEFARNGQPGWIADRDACYRGCGCHQGSECHRGGIEGFPPGRSPPYDHPCLPDQTR